MEGFVQDANRELEHKTHDFLYSSILQTPKLRSSAFFLGIVFMSVKLFDTNKITLW